MSDLLTRARRGEPLTELDIVDVHGHFGRPPFGVPHQEPRLLVEAMDRMGVRTVIASHIHCLSAGAAVGNDRMLQAVRDFPGRILAYVRLWPSSAAEVEAECRRCLDAGFSGVKLHDITGFPYTEPAYAPALAMAHERRLPVLLHTWGQPHQFEQIRALAPRYSDATFILGHSGAQGRVDEYAETARSFPNVYLDLTLSLGPRGLVDRLVEAAGADRVLWGSDGMFLNMAHQLGKVLGARMSDADKRRVLSTNARAILARARA